MREKNTKLLLSCTAFLFLCMLACVVDVVSARTIYVPDDYAKIQWAVDNASDGDTIVVRDGVFHENIEVDKRLTLRSENGSENCIVQAADPSNDVFHVVADYVNIYGFTIENGWHGIYLDHTENCNIANNNISNNDWEGIELWNSSNNVITGNTMTNDGVVIWGDELRHWNTHTIEGNTVNGKPLYYFKDRIGGKVPEDAGQVILANCTGMLVENLNIRNTDVGIEIGFSSQNTIKNNNVSDSEGGICLGYSSNNSIRGNNISNNEGGIYVEYSSGNVIYLNNFINNTYQVSSSSSTNIWNSTEKITYTYKGNKYENYLGNYWDDYNGSDANGDGIGETPYSIDSDKDNYPLIEGFENYFVETPTPTPAQTFDTGRPENPYPSISGKFVGTIRTNTKVIAKKLYTYACEGTGGHTEYALIWNETWCAYAEWEGYKEDWMNISFNKTVILMPYETYNITIVTGSYPQIHHTHSLKTENGWINCTEFTDANGKKYNDWIPAIMLWS